MVENKYGRLDSESLLFQKKKRCPKNSARRFHISNRLHRNSRKAKIKKMMKLGIFFLLALRTYSYVSNVWIQSKVDIVLYLASFDMILCNASIPVRNLPSQDLY